MKYLLLFLQCLIFTALCLLVILIGLSDQHRFGAVSYHAMNSMFVLLMLFQFALFLIPNKFLGAFENSLSGYLRKKSLWKIVVWTGISGGILSLKEIVCNKF